MDTEKRARLEAWLEYAEDLRLGPYFRDRAGQTGSSGTTDALAATPLDALAPVPAPSEYPVLVTAVERPSLAGASALEAVSAAPRKPSSPFTPVSPAVSLFDEKVENDSLEKIRIDIGPDCKRCKLQRARTNIVFGVGNPKAQLMFVGEGPGADEDAQGEPFVGRAGKLLTQMIEAMGLKRQDVYIANVVKCRPPENRLPEKDEIATCSPYLIRQIDVIKPRVVVCLGACSAQTLLDTTQGISKFRGAWFDFRGGKLMATYHPAYLLRNPAAKADVWRDLQKVMAHLGLAVKKR